MKNLIGIAGRKYHGKDTAASALEGYENVKFAGPLKLMVAAFLLYCGEDEETVDRRINGDLKEVPCEHFGGKTPRYVMQTLGTEWAREMVWQDIWLHAFQAHAAGFENVVCSDMRFPNEVDLIKRLGGLTVRVERPGLAETEGSTHPSEAAIDTLPVSIVIRNEGSVEELHARMKEIAHV